MRTPILVLATLLAGPALAQELPCATAAVKDLLAKQLAERMCLNDNIKLNDITARMEVVQPAVDIADTITMQVTEIPLQRTCEASMSFITAVTAEAIGPGPGIPFRAMVAGEARTITYKVGKFDDGRLYVRPNPGCWKITKMQAAK